MIPINERNFSVITKGIFEQSDDKRIIMNNGENSGH